MWLFSKPHQAKGGPLESSKVSAIGAGQVDGQPVNLAPSRGYDSPFVRSDWNSGLIYIRKGNDTEILDFRDPNNPAKTVGAPVTAAFPPGIGTAEPIIFRKAAP
jgi:hypothetical protein